MRRSYKERVIGYLKVLRPPLMILGLIAPLSLYLWSHKTIDFRGILVITAIFTGNLGYTLLNDLKSLFPQNWLIQKKSSSCRQF